MASVTSTEEVPKMSLGTVTVHATSIRRGRGHDGNPSKRVTAAREIVPIATSASQPNVQADIASTGYF